MKYLSDTLSIINLISSQNLVVGCLMMSTTLVFSNLGQKLLIWTALQMNYKLNLWKKKDTCDWHPMNGFMFFSDRNQHSSDARARNCHCPRAPERSCDTNHARSQLHQEGMDLVKIELSSCFSRFDVFGWNASSRKIYEVASNFNWKTSKEIFLSAIESSSKW